MLYDMARRYDEWHGESYSGSSCRGAMKGWHRHGVCSERVWPYTPGLRMEPYTESRARDALRNPLGAYLRVNHKDLVAMHAAFAEVGVLYASCGVHDGWLDPPKSGVIDWNEQEEIGYHAFAIVGYDSDGFWIQNSWGKDWGRDGYGHVSYDEWLQRGTDVWVARLAVSVNLRRAQATAVSNSALAPQSTGYAQADLRPHIVSLGNNGQLRDSGRFGTTPDDVRNIIRKDMRETMRGWKKKRVLLYAHGGLVPEQAAVQRVADYREAMLKEEIYPLCFIWKTDFWSTLGNILRDVAKPRSEGLLDKAKDLLLDRLDDTLEPLARAIGGKAVWDEMKENAILATTAVVRGENGVQEAGGAALVARLLHEWMQQDPDVELHIAAHSGGSVLMAPLLQLLTRSGQIIGGPAHGMSGLGVRIASVNLWAPAITMDMFMMTYVHGDRIQSCRPRLPVHADRQGRERRQLRRRLSQVAAVPGRACFRIAGAQLDRPPTEPRHAAGRHGALHRSQDARRPGLRLRTRAQTDPRRPPGLGAIAHAHAIAQQRECHCPRRFRRRPRHA